MQRCSPSASMRRGGLPGRVGLCGTLGVVLMAGTSVGSAQAQGCGDLFESLQIRQDIDVKDQIAKPALLQLQLPTRSDEEATLLAKVGVLTTLCSTAHWTVDLAAAYFRNTEDASAQDSRRLGLVLGWIPSSGRITPVLNGEGMVKQNRIKRTSSVVGSVDLTATGDAGGWVPNTYVSLRGTSITLVWAPYVGIEYEREFASDSSEKQFLRPLVRADVELLLGRRTEPVCQVTVETAVRRDVKDEFLAARRTYGYVSAGVTYNFARSKRVLGGIGATYVRGSDPTQDLARGSFVEIGLRVRIKGA